MDTVALSLRNGESNHVINPVSLVDGTSNHLTLFNRAWCIDFNCECLLWSLSWARCIHFTTTQYISLRFILILSSHLRLGRSSGLSHSGVLTKVLYTILIPPMCATCPIHHYNDPVHPHSVDVIANFNSLLFQVSPRQSFFRDVTSCELEWYFWSVCMRLNDYFFSDIYKWCSYPPEIFI